MRFYTQQHRHCCGICLHARSLYPCILDRSGKTVAHQKLACDRRAPPCPQTLPQRRSRLIAGSMELGVRSLQLASILFHFLDTTFQLLGFLR